MKNFIMILATIAILTPTSSYAATQSATVHVNGLVCDFCARAIEKVFGKKDEVASVKVDLDTKIISIDFKDNQTIDDETITKLVTDAGYKVVSIDKSEGKK